VSGKISRLSKGIYRMQGTRYFWYRWQDHGRRYSLSLRTENFSDAILEKAKILAEIEKRGSEAFKRVQGNPDAGPATPIDRIIDEYLAAAQARNKKAMKPSTAANVRLTLIRFAKETNLSDIRQAGQKMVSWIKGEKKAGKKIESLRTYIKLLKTLRRWLIEEHLAPSIMPDLEMVDQAPVKRKNWIEQSKIDEIIKAAQEKEKPDLELVFALHMLANVGMRRGELSQCRVDWFNLERGIVDIQSSQDWTTKNQKARVVPLKAEVKEFLTTYLAAKTGFVLGSDKLKRGKSRYRYDSQRRVRTHLRNSGVNATIHDLRRSFASNLASKGESLLIISRWIGDTLKVTEETYAHLSPRAGNIDR
jgi:integrase